MNENSKVIVAHPFGQHSDKLAAALKEAGMLHAYITTVYWKKGTLAYLLSFFLKGDNRQRIEAKKYSSLDNNEVIVFSEIIGILMLAVNRLDKKKRIKYKVDRWLERSFGRKVARYAIRQEADAVVMYDLYAGTAFRYLEQKAPQIKRIMDASAAYVGHMKDYFQEEESKAGILHDDYRKCYPQFWQDSWCKSVLNEVKYADHILAASQYSKGTYAKAGISEDKIWVVPYGINAARYGAKEGEHNTGCLNIINVGNFNPGKGLHYLMEAIRKADGYDISVTVIGPITDDSVIYQMYKDDKKVRYMGKINFSQMEQCYRQADVFVLPSLADGFSFSGLEAMACGLPVICTDHCGIMDLIEDGVNGFVVPTGDAAILQEKIEWCCQNREQLNKMGIAARETVKKYSWERYNQKIREAFEGNSI